jgi:hypothetical protein
MTPRSTRSLDTPSSRRSRGRLSAEELAELPPALSAAELADAVVELLCDVALAGRIMVCKGGEPHRLLPVVDWRAA